MTGMTRSNMVVEQIVVALNDDEHTWRVPLQQAYQVAPSVVDSLEYLGLPVDAFAGDGHEISVFMVLALRVDRIRLYAAGLGAAPALDSLTDEQAALWGADPGRQVARQWVEEWSEDMQGLDFFRQRLYSGHADTSDVDEVWSRMDDLMANLRFRLKRLAPEQPDGARLTTSAGSAAAAPAHPEVVNKRTVDWSGSLADDLMQVLTDEHEMEESEAEEVLAAVLSHLVKEGVPVDAYRGAVNSKDLSKFLIDAVYVDRIRLYAAGIVQAPGLGAATEWLDESIAETEDEFWASEAGRAEAQRWVAKNHQFLSDMDEIRRRLITERTDDAVAWAQDVWPFVWEALGGLDTGGPKAREMVRAGLDPLGQ